ncbi:hypothetical protein CC1G_14750 [Coprinopsis cinerea okayama7|uniref:Uncharacterized protein n=1 Tax=Coprinopsis cinerea (strain Okayama-7 / 130 / ATCC MYA-4618 / FGSC 9003) TaxID=240176 RepID=D6RNG6_COPC7|nr:hypothetical protein CC1G_14750 [Coprinopsis cinerea okayama7\|eukprot:XP_002910773.1 hypothetical protein CC1G_14750 [Coprinopsis cinerea okayama7\
MENDSDLMECVPPHSMTGSKRKRQLSPVANRFQREVCSSVYGLRHALYLDAQPTRNITCDITSCPAIFNLKGLIYGNNNHFVARYVDASDRVWFHDGMSFQRQCQLHGILTLDQPAHWLKRCDDKQLIYTWYSKTPNPPI